MNFSERPTSRWWVLAIVAISVAIFLLGAVDWWELFL